MSINIKIRDLVKKYNNNTVISSISLDIKQGEFFTLLGPSGCGKTTLLRMIAGFNSIEGGQIYFNDEVINDKSPQNRNIGMVFQNYAIFPHLNVKQNVAFGLTNRKIPKPEIESRVDKILQTVQIGDFKDRLPENLSGGQQQRVALARAIVIEPDVLLMDEPLSNLDAKLRVDMRNAIKEIQKEVGITTVYVTHDQEEAMAVSDRIAVMNSGVIQHIGTPQNIYHRPANVFVATFIGRTNIIERELSIINGKTVLKLDENYQVEMDKIVPTNKEVNQLPVKVSIRPEEFVITDSSDGMSAIVISNMFLGVNTHYIVRLSNGEQVEITQESSLDEILDPGTKICLKVKKEKINLFDYESEMNITKGVVNDVALS